MAKEKIEAERKEKKEKKKSKHSVENGVKKEKKDKKSKHRESDSVTATLDILEEKKTFVDPDAMNEDTKDVAVRSVVKGSEVKKEMLVGALVPFANPLADDKTSKKVLKGVKKAAKQKHLKRGVKEVVKSLRKSPGSSLHGIVPLSNSGNPPPGVVIIAADISPYDVISHIPVLCEDHNVPYLYVTSRAELGQAGSTKRPTSVVMVVPNAMGGKLKNDQGEEEEKEDFGEVYNDLVKTVQKAGRHVRI